MNKFTSFWFSHGYSLLFILLSLSPIQAQKNQTYVQPVFADPERVQRIERMLPAIDSLFKSYADARQFPSLSYGIIVDGRLLSSGSSGFIQTTAQIKASSSSMYRIASMSKSITALCILQLRDAGQLRLDDPARIYIPGLKTNKLLTKDAPEITIRHLLTHAAGFPEDNPWGDRQLDDSKDDLTGLIQQGTWFSNVPGVTYEYSNLGFALLGQIVEKVSGQTLEAYTKEKIFKPLGMTHTQWEYSKVQPAQLAKGYRMMDKTWVEEPLLHHGTYGAMGGLITSIEDFYQYVSLHMSAWPPRDETESPVLKRSSLREMHMPANFSGFDPGYKYPSGRACGVVAAYVYGLNWLRDCENRIYIGHSGGLPGFGSQWRFLPEYGIGVIAFANLTYAGLGNINLQVLDTLIRRAKLTSRVLPPSAILDTRKNQLISLLPDWNETMLKPLTTATDQIFAENFFPDYPLETMRNNHQALFKSMGKLLAIQEWNPENQLRGSFILRGEKTKLRVFFTLSPENPPLIQELSINEIK
ncbi:MAG: serine hydrolase domain-containing protein [Saprospiraceae bacterium]|nr:serine hydrolase domain-containing protein [Saprospiraceae bacterium]